jgi:formylmethanofuran dehydrogenase subunit E
MKRQEELTEIIGKATQLHGHLGPFLVIGVRMGAIAKKQLCVSKSHLSFLRAKVQVPLFPPYSCLLDGIQITTTCTIGNQRLTVENAEAICVNFTNQNSQGKLKIALKPRTMTELEKRRTENTLTEEYALELAKTPENQLFDVEKQ